VRHSAPPANPAAQLRSLIQDGRITVAALDASDDLTAAAASVHRLGVLTSGMWRAFGHELATAAERLDRQAQEHLDELQRRARRLGIDPDPVMAAAVAMAHLEEHRETLGTLLPRPDDEVRRLAAPELLLGFTVDDEVLVEGEPEEGSRDETTPSAADGEMDAAAVPRLAVRIWLFLWSAPLLPAAVTIVPDLDEIARSSTITDLETPVSVEVEMPETLMDALADACDLPVERALAALPRLGLACWSAHQADERGDDEDDEDDDDDDE
jgi:hypothetical protein